MQIYLRDIEINDLEEYVYLNDPSREFHKFNWPYYKKESIEELRNKTNHWKEMLWRWEKNILTYTKIIANKENNQIIGEVNRYWKSEETLRMEVGVVIFNERYWGKWIGYSALKLWINEIFQKNKKLVRIGISTWSGNERMIKLAEKLGLIREAVYRKARIVDGIYYDSISYGILREEWEEIQ